MNITITIDAPELVGAINNLAAALGNSALPLPPEKTAPVKIERPKPAPAPEKEEPEEEPAKKPGISLEAVRAKLAAFSAESKENQMAVRDALSRFGVKKLTDVKPEDYKELLDLAGVSP